MCRVIITHVNPFPLFYFFFSSFSFVLCLSFHSDLISRQSFSSLCHRIFIKVTVFFRREDPLTEAYSLSHSAQRMLLHVVKAKNEKPEWIKELLIETTKQEDSSSPVQKHWELAKTMEEMAKWRREIGLDGWRRSWRDRRFIQKLLLSLRTKISLLFSLCVRHDPSLPLSSPLLTGSLSSTKEMHQSLESKYSSTHSLMASLEDGQRHPLSRRNRMTVMDSSLPQNMIWLCW